jgi:hypothetical protein
VVRDYVAKYDNMTPQIADRLANKLLDLEQQRTILKRKYYLKIKAALDQSWLHDSFRWRTRSSASLTYR